MNNKKEKELHIIKHIYEDCDRYKIIPSEKPDFIVSDMKEYKKFGVEVTQMYYNQSSARLKEIPGYTVKLLRDGIPRKDAGILSPHQIYMNLNGDWIYIGNTIGQSFKTYDDYIDMIVRTIKIKNKKLQGYQKLDYYELFIEDKENYLFFKEYKDVAYLDRSEKIKQIIDETSFKRIYLFTIINKCRVLFLLGDVYSGPLYTNDEDIKKHRKYMNSLYNEDRN